MKNSILVAVDRWHMNSKYKMKVKRTSKLMVRTRPLWLHKSYHCCVSANVLTSITTCHTQPQAHDEGNQCNVGDRVKITSCRCADLSHSQIILNHLHQAAMSRPTSTTVQQCDFLPLQATQQKESLHADGHRASREHLRCEGSLGDDGERQPPKCGCRTRLCSFSGVMMRWWGSNWSAVS